MPHYYPVVFPAGRSLAGDSLGFHAYSLRVDNCTNQWYLEESTVSYIPPYSLGMCLRLYGTGVAILLAQAPVGQPQLAPIAGEQVVGVYSDQLRTEVAAAPIRNFALVQTVSDFQQGPMPATPPNSTTRLWADASGNLHILTPDGQDATIIDSSNYQGYVGASVLGGDLVGTVNNGHVRLQYLSPIQMIDSGGAAQTWARLAGSSVQQWAAGNGAFNWWDRSGATEYMNLDSGGLTVWGTIGNTGAITAGGAVTTNGPLTITSNVMYMTGIGQGPAQWIMSGNNLLNRMDGTWYFQNYAGTATRMTLDTAGNLNIGGQMQAANGAYLSGGNFTLAGGGGGGAGPFFNWSNGYWLGQYSAGIITNCNTIYLSNNGTVYWSWDGTYMRLSQAFIGLGNIGCQGVGPNYGFTAPNAGAAYGQGYANAWINASSREWKGDIAELHRALDLVTHQDLHAVSYTHRGEGEHGAPNIGFVADDWAPHVPEVVSFDPEGKPVGMDYARVGAITFEALKQYIERTDARLAALEGAA